MIGDEKPTARLLRDLGEQSIRVEANRRLRLARAGVGNAPIEAVRDEFELAESIAEYRLNLINRREAREHP